MLLTKKAFTLIELLGVIVVLGIIAAIAFPTVTGVINNTRKDTLAANATTLMQAAKAEAEYKLLSDETYFDENGTSFTLEQLINNGRINEDFLKSDPFGGNFDATNSKVTFTITPGFEGKAPVVEVTEVKLISTKYQVVTPSVGFNGKITRDMVKPV